MIIHPIVVVIITRFIIILNGEFKYDCRNMKIMDIIA